VALWPLYVLHVTEFYPGQMHARLMANGFFGGFILGFVGTALPRMLSSFPLTLWEMGLLLVIYLTMAAAYFRAKIVWGDWLFLGMLGWFALCGVRRVFRRADNPPPGFVLVLLGLLCAAAGAALAIAEANADEARWAALQHLLSYQGFVLFPILGVGPFILPRFFGLPSAQDLPESRRFSAAWLRQAVAAPLVAAVILLSFYLEYAGWLRAGPALRLGAAFLYIATQVPLFRAAPVSNAFSLTLKIAFSLLLAGFAGGMILPSQRVGLLHLTLIGGFAAITLAVATRVILGHSGRLAEMSRPNRWFLATMGVIWFAMVTRITGDFLLKTKFTHYAYGAVVWIIGIAIWSAMVLGKVLQKDEE
ncbi:MAG TPA: NnrS family protein, partial [Verrucomicrobiae bacterium]|jgi:uncharacterized protein involved in response to NO|nr:NnrS family protein [Verrucomicrobiae bacterium]